MRAITSGPLPAAPWVMSLTGPAGYSWACAEAPYAAAIARESPTARRHAQIIPIPPLPPITCGSTIPHLPGMDTSPPFLPGIEELYCAAWIRGIWIPHFPGDTVMIFRQLFDSVSGTYTYLLASRRGGEALIIDPVIEKVDRYIQLVNELDLKLVKAVDTHLHADHITGLGALRDRTHCITVMGEMSKVDVVSMRLAEADKLTIEGLALDVLYTPGHTDDSYSFKMQDRVFTGDTLLIRGTGRTDFQNGDSRAQYDSIFNKLLKLPDETLVFPAHDYKGETA